MRKKSNYQLNTKIYKLDSAFNWYQGFVSVWVLIWTNYLSFTQIGFIYSISLFGNTILELPSGALADLIGRKKTVLIGRFLNIIAYLLFFISRNFYYFLIGQILYQSNWAFESGAQTALLYDSLKENKKEKNYRQIETDTFFYCTLSMIIGCLIGGFLYQFDRHLPYLICIFTALISFFLSFFYQEPLIDSEKFTLANYLKQNLQGIKHIFDNQIIRSVTMFSVIISVIRFTGLWYLYEPRLFEGGFSAQWMGVLVAGTYLIRAIGIKLIPILTQRIKERDLSVFLISSQMLASFLSFLTGKTGAIISVYSRKFVDGFQRPIIYDLQNREIKSQFRATSLSAISLITNILIAGAGLIIGPMIEYQSARVTLGICGLLGLFIGLPAAIRLRGRTK